MEAIESLPREVQVCPNCGYDLHGTLRSGSLRCPECGYECAIWQLRELHASNAEGEPRSLPPRELRMRGHWFVPLLGVAALMAIWAAVIVMRLLGR